MRWIFWALLIIGVVLVLFPLLRLVAAAVSALFWVMGGLLILAAVLWAVATLSRPQVPQV